MVNGQPINDQTWAGIRTEFTPPTLEQVRRRLSELMEDPKPVMRQLVRDLFTGLSRWLTRVSSAWDEPCQRHALVMDLSDRSWDGHRAEGLTVANVGRVIPRTGVPGFAVLDATGEEFAPATEYLLELAATDRSPQTVWAAAEISDSGPS
ncbi:hypothetical protein [Arthrobacter sp. SO3]|uniref:hypothetical protein n=1 Tax=Arthrobacter sp. SO3 TaxID=1897057 RepID=UPI001CFF7B35|nr:hypothetical protein [Arthrobacter sp. SO3]MCB5291761.1 hypothetical protein [Arthrobacter sp. SO3]